MTDCRQYMSADKLYTKKNTYNNKKALSPSVAFDAQQIGRRRFLVLFLSGLITARDTMFIYAAEQKL